MLICTILSFAVLAGFIALSTFLNRDIPGSYSAFSACWADWEPQNTPALWTEVSLDEWPDIPENIPSTAPWMSGDKGTWKGQHYICQLDNCVWNPEQLPNAWNLVV